MKEGRCTMRARVSSRAESCTAADHGNGGAPVAIVGVVGDVRSTSLNSPHEADYFPALQRRETFTNILIRTNVSPVAMASVVRDALRAVDADRPLLQLRSE
jgi:hypothetical protein